MNRREALQSLAALASSAWAAEGYDPDGIEEWDPIEGGGYGYECWRFEAEEILSVIVGHPLHVELDEEFTTREVGVTYSRDSVSLEVDGRDGDELEAGSLASLAPDVAREVAVALYMAAEELERRGQA